MKTVYNGNYTNTCENKSLKLHSTSTEILAYQVYQTLVSSTLTTSNRTRTSYPYSVSKNQGQYRVSQKNPKSSTGCLPNPARLRQMKCSGSGQGVQRKSLISEDISVHFKCHHWQ